MKQKRSTQKIFDKCCGVKFFFHLVNYHCHFIFSTFQRYINKVLLLQSYESGLLIWQLFQNNIVTSRAFFLA